MTGLEFELFVAKQLKQYGYTQVRLTEFYDLGTDITAVKDGIKWGIQVKRYSGPVGVDAVRQVVCSLNYYECDKGMVITNSGYTNAARLLASSNDTTLIILV